MNSYYEALFLYFGVENCDSVSYTHLDVYKRQSEELVHTASTPNLLRKNVIFGQSCLPIVFGEPTLNCTAAVFVDPRKVFFFSCTTHI